MKKICFVTAFPLNLRWFMSNHILRLAESYDVTAVADFSKEDLAGNWFPGIRLVTIPIERKINLRTDLCALISLWSFFRSEHFDVVHSITPKGGLLAMTGARFAGVPHRIHCFTGQVWVTRRGLGRVLLKIADRLIASNANHVLTDSMSQSQFLELEKIVSPGQVRVLGSGSISGVDLAQFHPNEEIRKSIRSKWGIPQTECLFLFVGRLNRDKGMFDLAKAFAQLFLDHKNIWLAVVGLVEASINEEFDQTFGESISHVRRIGYIVNPAQAMAAADVLVLPSYREGFGNVVIEAAACAIPAIASRIYGLTDAIEENVTGLLHPPGDVESLRNCMELLCCDKTLRLKMGITARSRVEANFSMNAVTLALLDYYEEILFPERS